MPLVSSTTSDFVARRVDRSLERLIRLVVRLPLRDPIRGALAAHRRVAAEQAAAEYAPRAAALAAAVIDHDPDAVAALDRLAAEAIDRMRAAVPAERRGLARIERALYKQGAELLDDPAFPVAERAAALDKLDRLNLALGSYDGFLEVLLPLVERAEAAGHRPVRIHDLASGHAGFAVFLKQRLGTRVAVEASDLKAEYLEIGRRRAHDAGVEIDLFVADALALAGLRERRVDVVTCTQSVHHFSPGMIARVLGEAVRAARVGVCVIDGERSWLMMFLVGLVTALHGRSWVLFHDGVVSLRRMFYEEELGLLAALAPELAAIAHVETGVLRPAHAFVRATRNAPGG